MAEQMKLGIEICAVTFFDRVWNKQHKCNEVKGHDAHTVGARHTCKCGFFWTEDTGQQMDQLARSDDMRKEHS